MGEKKGVQIFSLVMPWKIDRIGAVLSVHAISHSKKGR